MVNRVRGGPRAFTAPVVIAKLDGGICFSSVPVCERDVGGKTTGVLAEPLAEHTAQVGSFADDGPPIHNTGIFIVIVLHDRLDVIFKDAFELRCRIMSLHKPFRIACSIVGGFPIPDGRTGRDM